VKLQETEQLAWLAWLPVLSTALYYTLPLPLQAHVAIQFLPQLLAYGGLAAWASRNRGWSSRLGLERIGLWSGVRWGLAVGFSLGSVNVAVILYLVPALGGDIAFLRETPHAQMSTLLMLPWFILLIAVLVELNFRGFLLGRLLALFQTNLARSWTGAPMLAIALSALVFAFDPFMVATFKHLHWIAVWDGLIWGTMWIRLRNLYATILAHAVEVIVMYSVLKVMLT